MPFLDSPAPAAASMSFSPKHQFLQNIFINENEKYAEVMS